MSEILVLSIIISEIGLLIWVARAKPSPDVLRKYRSTLLLRSLIPFRQKWLTEVDPADATLFARYRARYYVFLISLFALLLGFISVGTWLLLKAPVIR